MILEVRCHIFSEGRDWVQLPSGGHHLQVRRPQCLWVYVSSPLGSRSHPDITTTERCSQGEKYMWQDISGLRALTRVVLPGPLPITLSPPQDSHQTAKSMWNPVGNSFTQSMFSIISYRQPVSEGKTLAWSILPLLNYSRVLLPDSCSHRISIYLLLQGLVLAAWAMKSFIIYRLPL